MANPWDVSGTDAPPANPNASIGDNLSSTVQDPTFWQNLSSFGAGTLAAANARTPQGFLANGAGAWGAIGQGMLTAQQENRLNAKTNADIGLQRAQTADAATQAYQRQLQNQLQMRSLSAMQRIMSGNPTQAPTPGQAPQATSDSTTDTTQLDTTGAVPVSQRYSMASNATAGTPVPPRILDGVVQVESNWNPNVPDGAHGDRGLGQIIPSTAANPGLGLAPIDYNSIGGAKGAQANLRFTAQYLNAIGQSMGLKTTDDWLDPNKVAPVIARYNGGDPNTALSNPYVLAVGEKLARVPSYYSALPDDAEHPAHAQAATGAATPVLSTNTVNDAAAISPQDTEKLVSEYAQTGSINGQAPTRAQAARMAAWYQMYSGIPGAAKLSEQLMDYSLAPGKAAAIAEATAPTEVAKAISIAAGTAPIDVSKAEAIKTQATQEEIKQHVAQAIADMNRNLIENYYRPGEVRQGGTMLRPGIPSLGLPGESYRVPDIENVPMTDKETKAAGVPPGTQKSVYVDKPLYGNPMPAGPMPNIPPNLGVPGLKDNSSTGATPPPSTAPAQATPPAQPQQQQQQQSRLSRVSLGDNAETPFGTVGSVPSTAAAAAAATAQPQQQAANVPAQASGAPSGAVSAANVLGPDGMPLMTKQSMLADERQKEQGEAYGKLPATYSKAADQAQQSNAQMNMMLQLIQQSKPYSGNMLVSKGLGYLSTGLGALGADTADIDKKVGNTQALLALMGGQTRTDLHSFGGRSNTEYHAVTQSLAVTPENNRYGANLAAAQMMGMNDYNIARADEYQKLVSNGSMQDKDFENYFRNSYTPTAFIANRLSQTPEGMEFLKGVQNSMANTASTRAQFKAMYGDVKNVQQRFRGVGGIPGDAGAQPTMNADARTPFQ